MPPCSAETHLNIALYAVIETLSQEELDLLPVKGSGGRHYCRAPLT